MTRDTILVTGSRSWTDEETLGAWLAPMMAKWPRLVDGGAVGADGLAHAMARRWGYETQRYPVNVELDGPWPAAGPNRNQRMVDAERARVARVLAFSWWDETQARRGRQTGITSGTSDCVSRAIQAGLPVIIVTPGARP